MQKATYNYLTFSVENHEILIGKDAKSNDYLSLKFSKGNDYWFHVHGSPGSHVIMRWHKETGEPGKDLLKKIAALTAFYSKQKGMFINAEIFY